VCVCVCVGFSLACIPMVAVTATIVSTGKPTNESSIAASGVPNRAVDGNTDGNYGAGSCTHTDIEAQPWWTVDLQAAYAVEKVLRFCRAACAAAASSACGGRWLCITG